MGLCIVHCAGIVHCVWIVHCAGVVHCAGTVHCAGILLVWSMAGGWGMYGDVCVQWKCSFTNQTKPNLQAWNGLPLPTYFSQINITPTPSPPNLLNISWLDYLASNYKFWQWANWDMCLLWITWFKKCCIMVCHSFNKFPKIVIWLFG